MAAIMSATYPELYAATGIHSGLAYGTATDLASAFAAMHGTSSPAAPAQTKSHLNSANGRSRTIVFHGASDQRVHPSNAETILAEARAGLTDPAQETQHYGSAGGRAYTRTVITDASGVPPLNLAPCEASAPPRQSAPARPARPTFRKAPRSRSQHYPRHRRVVFIRGEKELLELNLVISEYFLRIF